MISATVLVVEDDHELRNVITRSLREGGFEASGVATAAELLERLTDRMAAGATPADLLVLDVGLPDADGRDLCSALRARGVGAPVLFLTAHDAVPDRLSGFAAGGDDYMSKPFDIDELLARLNALLRRSTAEPRLSVGELTLDGGAHAASCGGEVVALTPTEFRLLAKLAAGVGTIVRRHELLAAAWPAGAIVHDNTLDVYVARLRRKLRRLPGAPLIETAHGVGYSIRA